MSNGEAFELLIASGQPFEFHTMDYEQSENNDRYGYTGRQYLCRVQPSVVFQMDPSAARSIVRALDAAKITTVGG